MTVLLICVIAISWGWPAASHKRIPKLDRNSLPNCGEILVALTSCCASPKYSVPISCCAVITEWNNALCWCELNAFNSASKLAMDYYAFQFRARKCNLTRFFHPEIQLPVAGKSKLESTCPRFESVPWSDQSEGCGSAAYTARLREQRTENLRRLSSEDVMIFQDIKDWSSRMDSILTPGSSLFSVGMSFLYPRVNVKRYLLSRTSLVNGSLWRSAVKEETLFWRSTRMASYASSYRLGPYSFAKIEFVSFARCLPRIDKIYTQEEEAVRLFKQFVYFEPADRAFWKNWKGALGWCSTIEDRCANDMFPFADMQSCIKVYRSFQAEERVTCLRGQAKFPVVAFHGNTLSCRGMYLDLAVIEPRKFCPFLGQRGIGRCRNASCPAEAYNNVYAEPNPRFESTTGYTCGSSGCDEDWPVEET